MGADGVGVTTGETGFISGGFGKTSRSRLCWRRVIRVGKAVKRVNLIIIK